MTVRKRYSVQELSANPALSGELQKVINAFAGIQALPPNDPNSFYFLGGFHGEPFRGPVKVYPGPGNSGGTANVAQKLWWGGYCNHGNVLFPTWHRAYLQRVEKALQSIKGCEDVMLPFWDECFEMGSFRPYTDKSAESKAPTVIPSILTDQTTTVNGKPGQKNPLYSYVLQRDTTYTLKNQDVNNSRFSKPKDYETCRFPKRGVVSTEAEKVKSDEWNSKFKTASESTDILNVNVAQWLEGTIKIDPNVPGPDGNPTPVPSDTRSIYSRFQLCLEAPNYTVFSNTTSQNQWITDLTDPNERAKIVALESPHNSIHLAVGGFFQPGVYNANPAEYQEASGDMGDNETASFDPIFFFHHCFIDYVFWTWQKKNGLTKRGDLGVLDDYPGTITDEGSPIGLAPGSLLDMNTPLYPFRKGDQQDWVTSHDVTNVLDLGYDYGPGSLDPYGASKAPLFAAMPKELVGEGVVDPSIVAFKRSSGINRAQIQGSFVMRTVAKYGDKAIEVGRAAILSRLDVRACANCQTHLDAESYFPMYASVLKALGAPTEKDVKYQVVLDTYDSSYAVPLNGLLRKAHDIFQVAPGAGDGDKNKFMDAPSDTGPGDGALQFADSQVFTESI